MKKKKDTNPHIIPINRVKESERWVPIPGTDRVKPSARLKSLHRKRGNCYFAVGVSQKLFDFIYRSVVKLGLGEKTLIFSKGAVKSRNRSIVNSVGLKELDWDVGISMIIPKRLSYSKTLNLLVEDEEYTIRVMEIIVLAGLLKILNPKKPAQWNNDMAATIIALGWKRFEENEPAKVLLKPKK